jgi:hypothetical protein
MELVDAINAINWKNKTKEPIGLYNSIEHDLPYFKYISLPNCHLGQRKLLLCELIFYEHLIASGYKNPVIVYSGSAPGIHTPVMLEWYPTFNFIFVDPNYHNMKYDYHYIYKNNDVIDPDNKAYLLSITEKKAQTKDFANGSKNPVFDNKSYGKLSDFKGFTDSRVYVIQDYMTPELATELGTLVPGCFHVSDLRTNMFGSTPNDSDIIHNTALQILVQKNLKPTLSWLKFVTPALNRVPPKEIYNHEYVKEAKKLGFNFEDPLKFPFFDGLLYIQPWAGPLSSELRLLVDVPKMKIYNSVDHRGKMIYYNIVRAFMPRDPLIKLEELVSYGYDLCNDCALEIRLLIRVSKRLGLPLKEMAEFIDLITRYKLSDKKHGSLLEYKGIHFIYDVDYIEYRVDKD